MSESISLKVNGEDQAVDVEPDSMLRYALRGDLGLHGPKFGPGLSECGSSTAMIGGEAPRSSVTKLSDPPARDRPTPEARGRSDNLDPLQQAFIDEQAAPCGYCINGMIMSARALLNDNPDPDREDIKDALNDNLCRCGTHMRIVRAVERAAKEEAKG